MACLSCRPAGRDALAMPCMAAGAFRLGRCAHAHACAPARSHPPSDSHPPWPAPTAPGGGFADRCLVIKLPGRTHPLPPPVLPGVAPLPLLASLTPVEPYPGHRTHVPPPQGAGGLLTHTCAQHAQRGAGVAPHACCAQAVRLPAQLPSVCLMCLWCDADTARQHAGVRVNKGACLG